MQRFFPTPLRYAWVVDSAPYIYTAAGVVFLLAIWLIWMGLRRDPNARTRRCRRCLYNMTGVPGAKCPECGVEHHAEHRLFFKKYRRWTAVVGVVLILLCASGSLAPRVVNRGGILPALPDWALVNVLCVYDTEDSEVFWEASRRHWAFGYTSSDWSDWMNRYPFLARHGFRAALQRPDSDGPVVDYAWEMLYVENRQWLSDGERLAGFVEHGESALARKALGELWQLQSSDDDAFRIISIGVQREDISTHAFIALARKQEILQRFGPELEAAAERDGSQTACELLMNRGPAGLRTLYAIFEGPDPSKAINALRVLDHRNAIRDSDVPILLRLLNDKTSKFWQYRIATIISQRWPSDQAAIRTFTRLAGRLKSANDANIYALESLARMDVDCRTLTDLIRRALESTDARDRLSAVEAMMARPAPCP